MELGRVDDLIDWCSSIDEYATATADQVPVIRPSLEREVRWEQVCADLYTAGTRQPAAAGFGRLVVAWGTEASPVAAQFALRTGSDFRSAESLAEIKSAVGAAPERAVVVVAMAPKLVVRAVLEVVDAAATSGKIVGFLSGRCLPSLSFAAAKQMLVPRADLTGIQEFVATEHEIRRSTSPDSMIQRLTSRSLVKVIHAHGEGSHAKLQGVTVCGLLDRYEFPTTPRVGCSRPDRRCKRSQPPDGRVLFADELPAPLVAFICCNGFNVAKELYPTAVAVTPALSEGYAAAVITPLRPLIATESLISSLQALLASGTPIGEVAGELNRISAAIGQPTTFACHGDPCLSLPHQRMVAPGDPRARREPRLVVAPSDHQVPLIKVQLWLARVLRELEKGRRTLRAVEAWLGDTGESATGPLREVLRRIERLGLYLLKRAEVLPDRYAPSDFMRASVPVRLLIGRWDREAAQVFLRLRKSVDPFDLGHYGQLLARMTPGEDCPRCGSVVESYHYGAVLSESERRVAVLCPVCGPVRAHGERGLRLLARERERTGRSLQIGVSLKVPKESIVSSVALRLRFFDKAADRCVQEVVRSLPAEDQELNLDIDLPAELSPDLHSIRLIAVGGFDMAYARVRAATLPPLAMAPRPALKQNVLAARRGDGDARSQP